MDTCPWPLVGRDEARQAIHTVLSTQPPGSIVLAGPPGVGRTRLAREAMTLAGRVGRPAIWAAGAAPAAGVALGPFLELVPEPVDGRDAVALLQRVTAAVVALGPDPVVVVDDVQLLDRLSSTLLQRLAGGGSVSLVLTVLDDPTRSDPTAYLWKDQLAVRLDVGPLDEDESHDLLVTALGGQVETRTGARLWRLTGGVPLYLRELVEGGISSGRLCDAHGLWRWDGAMQPSRRLADLVLAQAGKLSTEERRVLDALAVAEPLAVDQLIRLAGARAVASLEDRRLVRDDQPAGSEALRLSQPIVGAVLRGRISEASQRRIRRALVAGSVVTEMAEKSTPDWVLAAGAPTAAHDPAGLIAAAKRALAVPELAAAEMLARAALDAGAGAAAAAVLLEATRWLGSTPPDACWSTDLLASATEAERIALASARAITTSAGLDGLQKARVVLQEASGRAGNAAAARLRATRDVVEYLYGDPTVAVRQALREPPAGDSPLGFAVAAVGLATAGRTGQALAAVADGRAASDAMRETSERLLARVMLDHAEVVALHLAGRIADLGERTRAIQRARLRDPEWPGDAVAALHCGWAALARGDTRAATRWLVESELGLARHDPVGLRPLAASLLTTVRALRRRPAGLPAAEPAAKPTARAFQPLVALGHAYAAAGEGRTTDAGRQLLEAAETARRRQQDGLAAMVLHHAVRFGRAAEVAGPLRALVQRTDAAMIALFAVHAEAVAAADGSLLDELSGRFQRVGALLLAADAAREAAAAHDRTGARRSAGESRVRAMVLARECDVIGGPTVDLESLPGLTAREKEVAVLAGRGLSNLDIAQRLVLSVRTVEAHLSHIYAKFGITRRADLAPALGLHVDRPAVPSPRSDLLPDGDAAVIRLRWT